MNYHFLPILLSVGLVVSGSVIAELTGPNFDQKKYKPTIINAKRLDANNDGLISLSELTGRQNQRFQKFDLNSDKLIDKNKFRARLVAMFNRVDKNNDGMLDDDEISETRDHYHKERHQTQKWKKRLPVISTNISRTIY